MQAEIALGLSRAQFKKFRERGLVVPSVGEPIIRGQISLDAINRMLFELQADGLEVEESIGCKPNESIVSLVRDVLCNVRKGRTCAKAKDARYCNCF